MKALREVSGKAKKLELENEKMKQVKGDPVLLKKTQDELQRLKEQVSKGELGEVTDKLDVMREKVALAEKNRDQERTLIAQEKRVKECDTIVKNKVQELEIVRSELKKYQQQHNGLEGAKIML